MNGQAQTLAFENGPSFVCPGQTVSLPINVKGNFGPDNRLRIQTSLDGQSWEDRVTELIGAATLRTQLGSFPPNISELYIRVTSSQPAVVSTVLTIPTRYPPVARLSEWVPGGDSLTINPGESVGLRLSVAGGAPYQVWFNDSLYSDSYDGYSLLREVPRGSTDYRLTKVANGCGVGTTDSRRLSVLVNAVPIEIVVPERTYFCQGKPLRFHFTAATPLPSGTQFFVVLKPTRYEPSSLPVRKFKASLEAETLVTEAPVDLLPGNYHVVVQSVNPRMETRLLEPVGIAPAQVTSEDSLLRVPYQTAAGITLRIQGRYTTVVWEDSVFSYNGDYWTWSTIRPVSGEKSAVYRIQSAYSAVCGDLRVKPDRFEVRIVPTATVDSLVPARACVGQTVIGFYRSSTGFKLGDTVTLTLFEPNVWNNTVVTATILDDKRFSFVVPNIKSQTYYLQAVFNGAERVGGSTRAQLTVKAPPSEARVFAYLAGYPYPDPYPDLLPGVYRLLITTATLSDQEEYTLNDGRVFRFEKPSSYSRWFPVTLTQPQQTFAITSARNECGPGTLGEPLTLYMVNPQSPNIQLQLPDRQDLYCPGDSVTLTWQTFNLPSGQPLRVEQATSNGWRLLTTTTSQSLRVGMQPDKTYQQWRITTDVSGSVKSNIVSLFTAEPPGASVGGYSGTYAGDEVELKVAFTGKPPFQYEWQDGLKEQSNNAYVHRTVAPLQTTRYQIRSVVDGCGYRSGPSQEYVHNVYARTPFLRILKDDLSATTLCEGGPLTIPYVVEFGPAPEGSQLRVVLLTKEQRLVGDLTPSQTQSPLRVKIPDLPQSGAWYLLRLILVRGRDTLSIGQEEFQGVRRPTVRLTAPNGGELISPSAPLENVSSQLMFEGQTRLTYVLSNGYSQTVERGPITVSLPGNKQGVYTLSQAYNECGQLPIAGRVRVVPAPQILQARLKQEIFCRDQPIRIQVGTVGEFDPANAFYLELERVFEPPTRLGPGRLANGLLEFDIPTTLPAGFLAEGFLRSTAPAQRVGLGYITIAERPSARLLSGEIHSYPGKEVLLAAVTKGSGNIVVRFTDGQTFWSYPWDERQKFGVRPQQTTTYRLAAVENECGTGTVEGEATVVILPGGPPTIQPYFRRSLETLCVGKSIEVELATTGEFAPDNVFTVQITDTTGRNFRSLPTRRASPTSAFLVADLPADFPPGWGYRLRVVSSNPVVTGAFTHNPLAVSPPVTGAVISPDVKLAEGDTATVVLRFTGVPRFCIACKAVILFAMTV